MPIKLWEPDHEFAGARRRRFKTMIRPLPLGTDGDKWRKVRNDPWSGRERRIFACSWHAHYVFYAALLELDPEAEFKSSLAHWKGRDDFHHRAPATANLNWGSMMYPEYAGQMAHYTPDASEMRALACEIAGTEPPGEGRDIVFSEHRTSFGELSPAGYTEVGTLKQSTMLACPHTIIAFEHYRADGTCKCNDRGENIMADWGYTWDEALGRWN
jgi:hypothetical protein